ncbi:unnamed protein product [Effrenium voratum]|uniref:Uncharacterized protein n=1 Tax=Effrenium voratum TaxID=2562239 RepID=A0AA36IPZ3_9DINO|nr:unnamed protein product [Effrenium voratum]CAJ1425148.1 unnamed protein product [Effrenium voratum]
MGASGKLADLNVSFLQQELANAKRRQEQTQERRQEAISQFQQHEDTFETEQRQWTAAQIQRKAENDAAIILQNWWLRVGMRRTTLIPFLEVLEQHRLMKARQSLAYSLLDLQHMVHDLHIEDSDRVLSCLQIQRWWRRVLALRVGKIIHIHHKVRKVKRHVEEAAAKVQSLFRGIQARRRAQALRESKQAAEAEAEVRMEQMKMQAILSIQNSYRKSVAVKQVQNLRARMFAAMMAQGPDDHRNKSNLSNSARPLWFKGKAKAEPKGKKR